MKIFLLFFLIAFNIFDVYATNVAINYGVLETNPLMLAYMNCLGQFWYIPKLIMILLGCVLLYITYDKKSIAKLGMWGCFIVYLLITLHHIWGLKCVLLI